MSHLLGKLRLALSPITVVLINRLIRAESNSTFGGKVNFSLDLCVDLDHSTLPIWYVRRTHSTEDYLAGLELTSNCGEALEAGISSKHLLIQKGINAIVSPGMDPFLSQVRNSKGQTERTQSNKDYTKDIKTGVPLP